MVVAPLTAACIATAACAYHLPQATLYAILATEGGHVGQAVANRNGTQDLGPFQINSSWGPALARFWNLPPAIALGRVQNDGCANAVAASAILAGARVEANGDLSEAVGFYHSHVQRRALAYGATVASTAASLMRQGTRRR